MSGHTSYLGKKIEVISTIKARYRGVLYNIDQKGQDILLQNVEFFGTEGRTKENEIAPSKTIYPFVTFKREDVAQILPIEEKKTCVKQGEDFKLKSVSDHIKKQDKKNELDSKQKTKAFGSKNKTNENPQPIAKKEQEHQRIFYTSKAKKELETQKIQNNNQKTYKKEQFFDHFTKEKKEVRKTQEKNSKNMETFGKDVVIERTRKRTHKYGQNFSKQKTA